ncbi:MAG: glutaredoxin [Erysipelotrichaceae bacterium]|nr:glutaredoxin [Erysipelotrichaceae bacterium]MDD3924392.1 glutaredoxin [Erysipelotrichaceae bacterium]MDD4642081.1 glutaredoxin [Erysipelotrichaceae bacterium]
MIKIFVLRQCPYCISALRYLDVLMKDPQYQNIEIKIIDENEEKALANSHDYFYVPTFYLDGKKLHEGVTSFSDVKIVLDKAIG